MHTPCGKLLNPLSRRGGIPALLVCVGLLVAGCGGLGDDAVGVREIDGRKVRCLTTCKEWERVCSTGHVVTSSGGASSVSRCRPVCQRYGKECYDVEE